MPTKTETVEELKRITMQIEHFEAQHRNTFSYEEKQDCLKTLKFLQTKDVIIELKWSEKNEENDIWKKIEQAQLDLN